MSGKKPYLIMHCMQVRFDEWYIQGMSERVLWWTAISLCCIIFMTGCNAVTWANFALWTRLSNDWWVDFIASGTFIMNDISIKWSYSKLVFRHFSYVKNVAILWDVCFLLSNYTLTNFRICLIGGSLVVNKFDCFTKMLRTSSTLN